MKKIIYLFVLLFATSAANATLINFGPDATYTTGGQVIFNLATPTAINGDATLNITFQGDLNDSNEGFNITLDGFLVGSFLDGTDAFIGGVVYNDSYTIAETDLQPLIGDGILTLIFDTNGAVNPITIPNTGPFQGLTPNFAFAVQGSLEVPESQVPEPSSLALLGLGLISFGFSRKKK